MKNSYTETLANKERYIFGKLISRFPTFSVYSINGKVLQNYERKFRFVVTLIGLQ